MMRRCRYCRKPVHRPMKGSCSPGCPGPGWDSPAGDLGQALMLLATLRHTWEVHVKPETYAKCDKLLDKYSMNEMPPA